MLIDGLAITYNANCHNEGRGANALALLFVALGGWFRFISLICFWLFLCCCRLFLFSLLPLCTCTVDESIHRMVWYVPSPTFNISKSNRGQNPEPVSASKDCRLNARHYNVSLIDWCFMYLQSNNELKKLLLKAL